MSGYNGGWIDNGRVIGLYGERSITMGSDFRRNVMDQNTNNDIEPKFYYYSVQSKKHYARFRDLCNEENVSQKIVLKHLAGYVEDPQYKKINSKDEVEIVKAMPGRKPSKVIDAKFGRLYDDIDHCRISLNVSKSLVYMHLSNHNAIKVQRFFWGHEHSIEDAKKIYDETVIKIAKKKKQERNKKYQQKLKEQRAKKNHA